MSQLIIFQDNDPSCALFQSTDYGEIVAKLKAMGIRFERWHTFSKFQPGDADDIFLQAYSNDINRLKHEEGYKAVDVVSVNAQHPNKVALRQKFMDEHTHSEDEVRFFVAGEGLFSLHLGDKIYEIYCEQGDLLGIPAYTPHWFDMGEHPNFVALRFFNNPEGWVANYTDSKIATHFSRLEN